MSRKSASSISLDPNRRALQVYPKEGTLKEVADLKTVGLKLSSSQARHLALVLLAASEEWTEVEITAYRLEMRRNDGTHQITVTTRRSK